MALRTKRVVRPDVICFGEILWDLFERDSSRSKHARKHERQREPIAREFRRELGGAPANVAAVLARLGVRSAIVGGVGMDKLGEALAMQLEADGVDTRYLVRLPQRTGLTFVARDAYGEPAFLSYRHETADMALLREHILPEMGQAKWVLVGSSTMMTPSLAAATERLLSVAQEAGAGLVVDLNVREHLWPSKAQMRDAMAQLVSRASIVKASFADLVAITGRRDILWLADHAPRAAWLVTQGVKGASAIGDHGFVAMPALRAKCIDATGAGDAFLAGALAVLLAAGAAPGKPAWRDERVWLRALEMGHELAAKSITHVGAVTGVVGLEKAITRIRAPFPLEKSQQTRQTQRPRRPRRPTSTVRARPAAPAHRLTMKTKKRST